MFLYARIDTTLLFGVYSGNLRLLLPSLRLHDNRQIPTIGLLAHFHRNHTLSIITDLNPLLGVSLQDDLHSPLVIHPLGIVCDPETPKVPTAGDVGLPLLFGGLGEAEEVGVQDDLMLCGGGNGGGSRLFEQLDVWSEAVCDIRRREGENQIHAQSPLLSQERD